MVSPSAAGPEPSSSATLNRRLAVLAVAGAAGWATFAVMITGMMARTPPGAGFDLELLLTAGRRVAAGLSPYEPSMLAGQSVGITTLFFSYPPLVAQAFSPLAAIPSIVVLAILLLAAPPAGAAVSAQIALRYAVPLTARQAFLVTLALLPFWFPFTLAMLFGNVDTLFVALFGLVLLAADGLVYWGVRVSDPYAGSTVGGVNAFLYSPALGRIVPARGAAPRPYDRVMPGRTGPRSIGTCIDPGCPCSSTGWRATAISR